MQNHHVLKNDSSRISNSYMIDDDLFVIYWDDETNNSRTEKA